MLFQSAVLNMLLYINKCIAKSGRTSQSGRLYFEGREGAQATPLYGVATNAEELETQGTGHQKTVQRCCPNSDKAIQTVEGTRPP